MNYLLKKKIKNSNTNLIETCLYYVFFYISPLPTPQTNTLTHDRRRLDTPEKFPPHFFWI